MLIARESVLQGVLAPPTVLGPPRQTVPVNPNHVVFEPEIEHALIFRDAADPLVLRQNVERVLVVADDEPRNPHQARVRRVRHAHLREVEIRLQQHQLRAGVRALEAGHHRRFGYSRLLPTHVLGPQLVQLPRTGVFDFRPRFPDRESEASALRTRPPRQTRLIRRLELGVAVRAGRAGSQVSSQEKASIFDFLAKSL